MAGSALHVSYRLPERGLDIALQVPAGSTTALVGPNGSGKSSTFEVVSGLLRPRGAEVVTADRRLHELPPHRRRVGLLLQQPLLFPTMDVLENTAFGLRAVGVRRAAAHAAARRALEEVGASELASRRPESLSGGQAQRVAVARALAPDPELLLLDEPMAALDEDSRQTIGTLLARMLGDRTAVLITHSAGEARALSDRVVVLDDGRVVQAGTWAEIAEAPASAFARRFARDRGEGLSR